jgi:hypothetical protein
MPHAISKDGLPQGSTRDGRAGKGLDTSRSVVGKRHSNSFAYVLPHCPVGLIVAGTGFEQATETRLHREVWLMQHFSQQRRDALANANPMSDRTV